MFPGKVVELSVYKAPVPELDLAFTLVYYYIHEKVLNLLGVILPLWNGGDSHFDLKKGRSALLS